MQPAHPRARVYTFVREIPAAWLAYCGPTTVAATTLAMLVWSWGTWPDVLVDFGRELYVPGSLRPARCCTSTSRISTDRSRPI